MSRELSDQVALARDNVDTPDRIDAAATKWGWAPGFVATVRQMLAEARALRLSGGILPARRGREFSGRDDHDSKAIMENWK